MKKRKEEYYWKKYQVKIKKNKKNRRTSKSKYIRK